MKYRVEVRVVEVVPPETTEDRYHNVTSTPGSETTLLNGTYMVDALTKPKVAQQVTDFLSRLAGELS